MTRREAEAFVHLITAYVYRRWIDPHAWRQETQEQARMLLRKAAALLTDEPDAAPPSQPAACVVCGEREAAVDPMGVCLICRTQDTGLSEEGPDE